MSPQHEKCSDDISTPRLVKLVKDPLLDLAKNFNSFIKQALERISSRILQFANFLTQFAVECSGRAGFRTNSVDVVTVSV